MSKIDLINREKIFCKILETFFACIRMHKTMLSCRELKDVKVLFYIIFICSKTIDQEAWSMHA